MIEGYDKKRKCNIVDGKNFAESAIKECGFEKNKKCIVDSHLSHNISNKKADLCIICSCDLKILKKRLEKRKCDDKKVRENIDAEIFEVCLIEAMHKDHKPIIYINNNNNNKEYIKLKKEIIKRLKLKNK